MGKQASILVLLSIFITWISIAVAQEILPHVINSSPTVTKTQLYHLLQIPTSNASDDFASSHSPPPAAAHDDGDDDDQPPVLQIQPQSSPARQQVENVIITLRRAGVYGAIAGAIDDLDLDQLPQEATMFVPNDPALGSAGSSSLPPIMPALMQYHIATQLLSFADLLHLPTGSRLPTLLPGRSILITRNDPVHYTIDGVEIVSPDLYMDHTFAIHGINGVLNFTVYGEETTASVKTPPPPAPPQSPAATMPSLNDSSPSTVLGEPVPVAFKPSHSSAAALLSSCSTDASFFTTLIAAYFIQYITVAVLVHLLQLIINV